jgi:hypothetical protein
VSGAADRVNQRFNADACRCRSKSELYVPPELCGGGGQSAGAGGSSVGIFDTRSLRQPTESIDNEAAQRAPEHGTDLARLTGKVVAIAGRLMLTERAREGAGSSASSSRANWHWLYAAALAFGLGGPAQADVIWTGSGTPGGRSATATATFSITGTTLTIDLVASGGGAGKYGPGSGLSGVFFDIAGMNNLSLTPVSATIPAGSSIVHASACGPGPCTGITNVDGEWGYQHTSSGFSGFGAPNSHYGIGSAGYLDTGLSHDVGNFNNGAAGANLDNPASLSGANFELFPSGVSYGTSLTNVPVVETEVDAVLTGLPVGTPLTAVTNVSFQYGTNFGERGSMLPGRLVKKIPEPGSLVLLGGGLIALWAARRRTRRA